MVFVFYGFVVGGAVLLALDLAGRLSVSSRVGLWRTIGVVAAAGPGLAPILALLTNRLTYSGVAFPMIAVAYLTAFVLFTVGALDWADRRRLSAPLRGAGYLLMLVLVALPSFVLLSLGVLVFVAGVGLVRVRGESAGRQ